MDYPPVELGQWCLCAIRDLCPDEINATFLANRTDGLRVGSVGHILTAVR
jgi:hypothetical protein